MTGLANDLRFALRTMGRSPAFALVAIATLALGIGANTAIFSVVDSVLLRPLPYPNPGALVAVGLSRERGTIGVASQPDFRDWRARSRAFVEMAAFHDDVFTLTGRGPAVRLDGVATTANFFDLLGVRPVLGRGFAAGEDEPGRARVALLTYATWQGRFHGDPEILGTSVTVDDVPTTVVGILPRDFRFLAATPEPELWVPMPRALDVQLRDVRHDHYLNVLGRLAPGVTVWEAQADMERVGGELLAEHPADEIGRFITVQPLHDLLTGGVRVALWVLLGAVGFVLLIACANVANLLLARATARQRELAIRVAVGASRARVVRQLLTESLLLAFVGGTAGALLAVWALDALARLLPSDVARLHTATLDARVLLYTFLVSTVTGVAFGLVPALQVAVGNPHDALAASATRTTPSTAQRRARGALVVGEIAVALLLLVGAGLTLKSLHRLSSVSPGFESEGLYAATIVLPDSRYHDNAQIDGFYAAALAKLQALPGARSVAVGQPLPFTRSEISFRFEVAGQPPPAPGYEPRAWFRTVSPSFFAALGVPVRRGRAFTAADDDAHAPPVAVVNDAFVRQTFGDRDPIGQRITIGYGGRELRTIVGVVADVKDRGLDAPAFPEMYTPFAQIPQPNFNVVVRSDAPVGLAAAVRAAITAVDAAQPVGGLTAVAAAVRDSTANRRLGALLLGVFGGIAVALALVGVYGVMSYTVRQRTREMGIRLVLGARPGAIAWFMVREAAVLGLAGIGLGLVAALALSRVLGTLLYDVAATDPATYGGLSVLLLGVAMLASWLPARRAARVDPMIALRTD